MNTPEQIPNNSSGLSRPDLPAIIGTTLLCYIFTYLLVPYKPWDWHISFHTPILGVGLAALLLRLTDGSRSGAGKIPAELVLFGLAVAAFVFSAAVVHLNYFSRAYMLAYAVSFLCFLFLRLAMSELRQNLFYLAAKLYLSVSGLLMLLQVNFAGVFYVPGFFGQTNFGKFCQAWGFANTHILAGGILAWLLSITLAGYAFSPERPQKLRSRFFDLVPMGLGAGGLLCTLSRGAWLGLAAGAAFIFLKLAITKKPKGNFFRGLAVIAGFFILFDFLPHPGIPNLGEKITFIAQAAVKPEKAILNDGSVNTRAKAWGVAIDGIRQSPFWGIGIGQYPAFYEAAFPTLFAGEAGKFDPNPKQIPHNSYLYYAVEAGLIPTFFLLVFIGAVFLRGWRAGLPERVFPFLAGLAAVCSWIATCDYMNERIFWIALGALSGISLGKAAPGSPAPEKSVLTTE